MLIEKTGTGHCPTPIAPFLWKAILQRFNQLQVTGFGEVKEYIFNDFPQSVTKKNCSVCAKSGLSNHHLMRICA